jgi:hypothetical protein
MVRGVSAMTMIEQLQTLPDGLESIGQIIGQLDTCFLQGFVAGQGETLNALTRVFAGTPLENRLIESAGALTRSEFLEHHFVTLAAARAALQGALHDSLRNHALTVLRRPVAADEQPSSTHTNSHPLLDSTRHWLMELAITGFARVESSTIMSFLPTLSQLRASAADVRLSGMLTGFINELMAGVPVKDTAQVPLWRWCDLWSMSMLYAVGSAEQPATLSATGTLYPLGVEVRQHAHMASLVVYGVLVQDTDATFVRQTWSSFKVGAIGDDELWLLFPEAQSLLQGLAQGKSLKLTDMPVLPSGDLLWNEDCATTDKKYKPLDIALKYLAPDAALNMIALPPLERHPIQIAEPVAFTDYQIDDAGLHLADGSLLQLDTRRALSRESIEATTALFGLLRYNAGQWSIQVLTAGNPIGKFEIIGERGIEWLKKPPKSSSVVILKERASRLLRG